MMRRIHLLFIQANVSLWSFPRHPQTAARLSVLWCGNGPWLNLCVFFTSKGSAQNRHVSLVFAIQWSIVKTTSLTRLSLQMLQSSAFCVFANLSGDVTGGFFFPMYACILLSSSRMFASKTYTASSLCIELAPKVSVASDGFVSKPAWLTHLFLLWDFGLLAVCSIGSFSANSWSTQQILVSLFSCPSYLDFCLSSRYFVI